MLKEFEPGGRIVMQANADYFRGPPKIKRIVMTAVEDENARVALLEKGTVDAAGIVPKLAERVRRNGRYDVFEVPTADARVVALPNRDPVLRDPAVRRALSLAVDREKMAEVTLDGAGEPAFGPIMKGHWAYSDVAETRYDPAAAERRLDAAGWARVARASGRRTAGALLHADVPSNDSVRKDLALAFTSDMSRIGVEVKLQGLTFDVIEKRQDKGATEFGYGTPTTPTSSSTSATTRSSRRRTTTPSRTTPAPVTPRSTRRWTPSARRWTRASASGSSPSCRRTSRRTRAGYGSCACATSRGLQAGEWRRPAGRAARARVLARHLVEPRGLVAGAQGLIAMLKLIVRRLALLPAILLAVAAMTFVLTAISPFDPVDAYVGAENNVSLERKAEIAHAWGLDQPMYEQFGRWVWNVVQGDMGNSIVSGGQPVAAEIASRASASIALVGGALALVLVGGLVFGVLAAAFRGTFFDWLVRTLCYFNTAAPSFWIGLLALYVFSIELGWLPAAGTSDPRAVDGGVDASHLVLPMLVLAMTQYAWFTLFVRNTLLEVLREDHVQFARPRASARSRCCCATRCRTR